MLKLLTLYIIVITESYATYKKVDSCPTSISKWKARSRIMNCREEDGLYYHCILDDEDILVESCLPRKRIPPGSVGCPSVSIHGDSVFHEAGRTDCPRDNIFCPASTLAYHTDQLYGYPICFRRVFERAGYEGKECDNGKRIQPDKNANRWIPPLPQKQTGNSVNGLHTGRSGSTMKIVVLLLIRRMISKLT